MFFIRKLNMSKKNVPKKTSNKIFIVFFLAILAVVTLVGFIYYQSQRPNFRDLEAAFNELNIPSDWQQVSETKVTGYKGLFCFNAGIDEACPIYNTVFSATTIQEIEPKQDVELIESIAQSGYFQITERDLTNCSTTSEPYFCTLLATKGNLSLKISIGYSEKKKIITIELS